MSANISEFAARLRAKYPDAKVRLDIFGDSGAMLSAEVHNEMFVLEYHPDEGFGINRVSSESGFLRGSQHSFATLTEAAELFTRLMDSG